MTAPGPAPDRSRLLRRLALLCVVAGVVATGFLVPLGVGIDDLSYQVPTVSGGPDIDPAKVPLATTVQDRNGATIATLYAQYRTPVSYAQIAPTMTAAILAVEDRRFFDESALDPTSIARAVVNNASGGDLQGASTITQQYVKNYLIDVVDRDDPAEQAADRADTVGRKVREAEIAVQVSHAMSKQDVLAGYLDLVEFSGSVYGVATAAQAYFGTTASALTVPQAALLAGMVNNPTLDNPYTHPQQALARRNVVIDAMVQDGSLDAAAGATAKAAPLGVLANGPVVPGSTCMSAQPDAGFFCAYAVSYLEQAGFTDDQLATGGYTIRTTLDPAASQAIKDAVDADVPTTQNGVANTFALVQPGATGHQVLAMVANRNYGTDAGAGETATNIVADPSNVFGAGSSFKIFTTAAALEAGTVGFDSALPDPSSACFPVPGSRTCYPVHNDGAGYPDPISLQDALATSPNVAFVGLEEKTGLPAVIAMAQKLGLRTTLASNDVGRPPITDPADPLSKNPQYDQPQSQYYQGKPSFTLGDSPVSTLEMANVSATILSGGVWCPPTPILSVTDRTGAQVPVNQQPCAQVVPPGLAHTLAAGLSRDTTIGTSAAAASAAGWTHPGIGKTGTTNASESVAFVGGVDDYAAASMVFADGPHPQEVCPGTPVHLGQCGSGAFGGTVAAPPYFAAMKAILGGQPDVPVPPPDPAYLEPRDGSSTVHAPN
ncbi:transglycosylase domain-containing protein [Pseudonocardia benzenivorans]|uniref:Transglycosylase domain-containing protein n=1 Tax=Pseudonocardia benzenivorans TaxID=228005 RepID=A0ABW3VH67_9PSEU